MIRPIQILSFGLLFALVQTGCNNSTGTNIEPGTDGFGLVGTKAPDWKNDRWINSRPLYLSELKGKVVLLRWWVDKCRFCAKSSDALNEFNEKFTDEGLVVIGMFHPKPRPERTTSDYVQKSADNLGFKFPIAIDDDWATLKSYWLDDHQRGYTSVSFLIDKEGIIRYVHPGPEYHSDGAGEHKQCRDDFLEIEAMIVSLLAK